MEPDITLILSAGDKDDAKQIEIKAWSQVLVNTSSYFRVMLQPDRFAEGTTLQKEKALRIDLPETDPAAMQVVIDVLHAQSDKVPMTITTLDELYDIAVIVDKFDAHIAFKPWFCIWRESESLRETIDAGGVNYQDLTKWVFICHALGFPISSKKHLRILEDHLNASVLEDALDNYLNILPSSLLTSIQARRDAIADGYRTMLKQMMDGLLHGDLCQNRPLRSSFAGIPRETLLGDRFHCASINFGNISIATCETFGIDWRDKPWTDSVINIYRSMIEIADRLNGVLQLREQVTTSTFGTNRVSHVSCSLDKILHHKILEYKNSYDPPNNDQAKPVQKTIRLI